jgi:adenylate cyclase
MKLRFRVALIILLAVLVISAVFLEGLFAYVNARRSADDLSAQVLEQTTERVQQQIASLLANATEQAALSERMLRTGQLRAEDFPGIVAFWEQLLAVNPEITSLYIGLEATGECTGVSRLRGGKFTVWQTNQNPANRRLELREFWLKDYPRKPYAFDPSRPAPDIRTRPWYIEARQAQQPIWTETFRFLGLEATQNVEGVTYAVPFYGGKGDLLGVVSVDFDLGGLSRFLQTLPVGQRGFAFVVELRGDGSRHVIAHPDLDGLYKSQPANDKAGAETPGDPRLAAFMAQVPQELAAGMQPGFVPVRFSQAGTDYLGRYRLLAGRNTPHWLIGTVLPEADVLEGVYRNNRNTIVLGILVLVVAVGISLYISRQVARPLERIAEETHAIGLLQVEPRPVAHSLVLEVDRLAVATEEMKRSLRSFQKYVPADLVRSLLRSGQEARLGGERRSLTVYFSDIVNFAAIAEALAPEQLVECLGEYLGALSQPILETGGTVDKYIGDAIMAFWGAPERHAGHAAAACSAALRSREVLAGLRSRWQAQGRPPFFARIGLNTGDVVVGNIGSSARLNYTVIGDAVNLASRLEQLNKHYGTEILISESTYAEARESVAARPLDWVSVKGRTGPVMVYELLALRQDADQTTLDLIGLFSETLDAYRSRNWARAIDLAEQVLRVKGGDRPALRLIERCKQYQAVAPPDEWDGVCRMD